MRASYKIHVGVQMVQHVQDDKAPPDDLFYDLLRKRNSGFRRFCQVTKDAGPVQPTYLQLPYTGDTPGATKRTTEVLVLATPPVLQKEKKK